MKELIRAAQRGSANEQFNLGVLYSSSLDDNGYVITPNRAEAIKWLERAAQQGLPRAQMKLAEIYAHGHDLPQDHIRACAWFLMASKTMSGIHRHMAQTGYDGIASHLTSAQIEKARCVALQGCRNAAPATQKART